MNWLFKEWLNFLFPPLCQVCKESCATTLFCPSCWEQCSLPDPAGRCRHCFEEMEEEICLSCRNVARLPFPSAFVFEPTLPAFHLCAIGKEDPESLAAFSLVQWERLDWPVPDVVIPLPGAKKIARAFGSWLGSFYADVLRSWSGEWECSHSILEEESLILLIAVESSFADIDKAFEALSEAFPKKLFVLSLTPLKREPHDPHSISDSDPDFHRDRSLLRSPHCSAAAGLDRPASW